MKRSIRKSDRHDASGSADQNSTVHPDRLSVIIDHIQAGYFFIDTEGRFRRVNRAWLRMHGYESPAEIIGQHFSLTITDADQHLARDAMAALLSGDLVPAGFLTRRCKDGSIGYQTISANPVIEDGQIIGFEGFLIDATPRHLLMEELRRERDRLRNYLNTVETVIVALDSRGIITAMNSKGCRLFGYAEEELIGKSWFETCLPQPQGTDEVYPVFLKLMAGKIESAEYHENPVITKTGDIRYIAWHNTLLRDDQGRITGTLSSGDDITSRRRMEQALRESEERYRTVADFTYDWEYWIGPAGEYIYISPSCERITGWRPEALQADPGLMVSMIHPDDREAAADHLLHPDDTTLHRLEYRILTRDGVERWIGHRCQPVHDANGRFIGRRVSNRDITERKKAERTLQETINLLTQAERIGRMGSWSADMDENLTVSAEMRKIMGFNEEEAVTGEKIRERTHPDDRETVLQKLREAVEKGSSVLEHRVILPDKTVRFILANMITVYDDQGKPLSLYGAIQDITERKLADEALRASEAKYRNLFNNAVVGMYRTKIDGSAVLEANQALCDIFERTREEILSEPSSSHWADPEARRELIRLIEKNGFVTHFEADYIAKSGKIKNCLISAKLYPDEGYLEGTTIEITEQKRAEENRLKLEEQLRQAQKLDAIGRLAGGVAHDFNNMLAVIIGHAELALDHIDPAAPPYADLLAIRKATEHSAGLVRHLLAFARKQTIAPKVIHLNETVQNMFKILKRLIGEDKDLVMQSQADLWNVRIDPGQVDQILANLCINARDAIAGQGRIVIATRNITCDEKRHLRYESVPPGSYVLLAVTDNGCGMDDATLAQIFEPFFTTKEIGKGSGLGLSTVYGIVTQNSGFIDVRSTPGRGTTFDIYLPRYEGEQTEHHAPAATQAQPGHETILLVEDEPSLLKMTDAILRRLGYTVLPALTPADAVRLATEHCGNIHLLITDVIMPDMNGRDLAEKLRLIRPGLRCLFMSGYTADVIAQKGILNEGVEFIQKPFTKKDLAAKVREMLEQPRADT